MSGRQRGLWALGAVVSLGACHDFADLVANGRCGNAVLEPGAGEECDSFAPDGARCGDAGVGACHFVCEDAACPAGFLCGTDDVCRRPSAQFSAPATLNLAANELLVAEVDGDGRDDILAVGDTAVSAAFADADGVIRNIVRVPLALPERPPRTGDLDGDGRAEVLLAMVEGVQVLRGTATRSLLPIAPPVSVRTGEAQVQAIGVPTSAPFLFDDALFAGLRSGSPSFALSGRSLTADLIVGRLAGSTLLPLSIEPNVVEAPRLAIGVDGGREVLLTSVACAASTMCAMPLDDTIALPAGTTLTRGAFFGDIDGDHRNDVLVQVRDNSGASAIAVALGEDSGFGSATLRPELRPLTQCPNCQPGENQLQGVADVTGDGVAEFIVRSGIMQANGTRPPATIASAVRPWATSQVVDINGDGLLDVIGTGPFALDVILSRGDGVFINRRVGAGADARAIATGDFDGDLAPDVALLDNDGVVRVLFSNDGILEGEVAIVGEFPGATSITALRDVESGDGIDDLLIVREGEGGEDPKVYVARGTSSQELQTLLPRSGRGVSSIAAGHVREGAGTDIVTAEIVPGANGRPAVALFVQPSDQLSDVVPAPIRLQTEGCSMPSDFDVDLAAHDFDGDGLDELVLIEQFRTNPVPLRGQPAPRPILVGHVVNDTFVCDVSKVITEVEHPSGIVFADVDGDGDDDLAVPLSLQSGQPRAETPRVGLAVFRNEHGVLAAEPEIAFGDGDVLFSALRAFHTAHGDVVVAAVDDAIVGLGVDDDGALSQTPLVDDNGGFVKGVAVGDVDGNGLDDVVVSTTTSTIVYPQLSCPANEDCL